MTYPPQPTPPTPPRYAGPAEPAYLPGPPADPQSAAAGPRPAPQTAPAYAAGPGYPPSPYGYAPTPLQQGPGKKRGKALWIVGGVAAFVVLASGGAAAAIVLWPHSPAPLSDQAAIERVTVDEINAATAHDIPTALKLTCGAMHDGIAAGGLPENTTGVHMKSSKVDNLKITGDTATADVTAIGIIASKNNQTTSASVTYTYQKIDGDWKISGAKLFTGN